MNVASTRLLPTALLAVYLFVLSSCLKDKCTNNIPSKVYTPVYAKLDSLRSSIRSESPHEIASPGKIYLYGNYIFLNELNKGIHVIDNSNPANPQKIAFINIPGNVDLAVKGNVMYVDSYIDLVALDISDPHNIRQTKRLNNVFPQRQYEYGIMADTLRGVIVSFSIRDTVLSNTCNEARWNGEYMYDGVTNSVTVSNKSNVSVPSATGKAGSTARFGLMNNTLYTVDYFGIQVFSVQQASEPVKRNNFSVPANIETIFPYDHYIFIGSTTGMLIYDVSNPELPAAAGTFSHIQSCDPVVVEGKTAYVTLRSGTICGSNLNQLDVLNVANVASPQLLKTYPMSGPYGLGIDGTNLFVCEGTKGLHFMDATDPLNVTIKYTVKDIEAYDVIPNNHVLLVTAKDGLYQYDYTNLSEPALLSKIGIVIK
ncbi:hypothetical protein [Chitinophaga sp.]|uniref:LVIVD repeat-containing protein n=1 Tax=Chitinophaga sp. TaxID=1869181 RepID=UPI0031D005CA